MNVEIRTPEKSLFSGTAEAVKLPGTEGSFEILNNHAPIIASLAKGNIRISSQGSETFFSVESGFVEVLKNEVVVLVEGGEQQS